MSKKDVYTIVSELKQKHRRTKTPKHKTAFPNLKASDREPVLSNNVAVKGGFKRDKTTDHKWRRGSEETVETISAIQDKANRVRPLYGKGNYQFSTDGDNTGEIRIYRK